MASTVMASTVIALTVMAEPPRPNGTSSAQWREPARLPMAEARRVPAPRPRRARPGAPLSPGLPLGFRLPS